MGRVSIFPAIAAFGPCRLSGNAGQVLQTRYLKKDDTGAVIESPEQMLWRVALAVAEVDERYGADIQQLAEDFYREMHALRFLPNSPTLMNAGRGLGQLSACFVLPIEDSLDSIFQTIKHTALIHKSGGGTGFSFSRIRPKGERVKSTHGMSSGPVPFLHVFDAATDAVRQGGARRGANMGVLRIDHPDILDFVEAKDGGTQLANFNLSVAVTHEFMQALEHGDDFVLIHPVTGKAAGHLKSAAVFSRICRRAWECGDPGLLFLDRINADNPTPELGDIECTNPCGEQPLLPYESCNLGSINLAAFARSRSGHTDIDYGALARTVRMAVHFLDNVIDANRYPLPQVGQMTRGNRKVGLGVMGWADLLVKLGIPYGSDKTLLLAEKVMGFVQRCARNASAELARARGAFPNFDRSRLAAGGAVPVRNASITTVAPTGTISIIAGCSSGIEPLFALSYTRGNILDGATMSEVHWALLEQLHSLHLDDEDTINRVLVTGSIQGHEKVPRAIRDVYATALEIAPEWHVRMQAAFQKYCDSAVSKTVNLPFGAAPSDVADIYKMAYRLGCKGITVYRDRCRSSQVLNIGCAACA